MRFHCTCTALAIATAALAQAAHAESSDFDGDGRDDLVMNVGIESIGAINDAGAVNVIYGSGNGLTAAGDQFWHQDVAGVKGACQDSAQLGFSSATGDFDGDGRDDLALGAPGYDVDGENGAGAVAVLYGHASGLRANGDQLWHRGVAGVQGDPATLSNFGWNLAAGDFDGDGFDDLVVGAPFDDAEASNAGAVQILYGSPSGLVAAGDQVFSQNTPGIVDDSENDENFGYALIAGDFDGDGRDDLAIGVPAEEIEGVNGAGAVHVLYGSNSGLRSQGDQFWHKNTAGVTGSPGEFDYFGFQVAAGDFDGDGRDDLAIGTPLQNVSGLDGAGGVHVLYGRANGLSAANDKVWHQDSAGIGDKADQYDNFGTALATGDFNGDGRDDLAIGIPFEDPSGISAAGAVAILFGSASGLRAEGDQFFHQNSAGVAGTAAEVQLFGASLLVGDFDGDGRDDLAVFAPYTDVNGAGAAGSVTVFYGSNSGISLQGEQIWNQDSPGVLDTSEANDFLGFQAPGYIT